MDHSKLSNMPMEFGLKLMLAIGTGHFYLKGNSCTTLLIKLSAYLDSAGLTVNLLHLKSVKQANLNFARVSAAVLMWH